MPEFPEEPPLKPYSFTLKVGPESLKVSGWIPEGECPADELVPVLLALGEAIVSAAIRQRPAGSEISCGPGCGACCRQLVPISLTEAAYLHSQVLPGLDEAHRSRVEKRIADAAAALKQSPLWEELQALPAANDPVRRRAVGLRYFAMGIPCPFLEDESCSIHPQRPLACREYLVTSPAVCCARPDPAAVNTLPVPQKPSHALIKLDAAATGTPGWCTFIEALSSPELAPAQKIADPTAYLQTFLARLLE